MPICNNAFQLARFSVDSWDDSQIIVVYDETVKAQSVAAGLEEREIAVRA